MMLAFHRPAAPPSSPIAGGGTRSPVPVAVIVTLLNANAVRGARLRVNLGWSDEPVWETFHVSKEEAGFTVTCTSRRPPEFWQGRTTGSFSDPIGTFMPTMDPWVSTSRRVKRAADGDVLQQFTYASYGGLQTLQKLFEFMVDHNEFLAELVRTPQGPALLTATGRGDGDVRFLSRE
jgi:hypothetical protein